jgi:hypothetical protein
MLSLAEPVIGVAQSHRDHGSKTDGDMNQQNFELRESNRRGSTRFGIRAPAVAKIGNHEIWAFTRDISTCGAYLNVGVVEDLPDVGEILDLVIKVPPTISSAKPCFITGRGRVIRIEDERPDNPGLAVEILDFAINSEVTAGNREGSEDTYSWSPY